MCQTERGVEDGAEERGGVKEEDQERTSDERRRENVESADKGRLG